VKIYEAMDITSLTSWSLVEEIEQQNHGVSCITWNPNPFDKPTLAVASGIEIKIYEHDNNANRWILRETPQEKHRDVIHDISWAPNIGRNYDFIATASKDKTVAIWKITKQNNQISTQRVASFDDHQTGVWRVEWNSTGTILASSGDDGVLRLWKTNFAKEWKKFLDVST